MAIVRENFKNIKGEFVKTYSDEGFYIQRDEELYIDAIDPKDKAEERIYEETNIPIEPEVEPELNQESESTDNESEDQDESEDQEA